MKKIFRNPLLLLTFYISTIFGFAFIYCYCYPDKFYHSTLKFEDEFQNLKLKVLSVIKESIIENFKERNGSDSIKVKEGLNLRIYKIKLENIKVVDDDIMFTGFLGWDAVNDVHFDSKKNIEVGTPSMGPGPHYYYIFTLKDISKTPERMGFGENENTHIREIIILSGNENPINGELLFPFYSPFYPLSIIIKGEGFNYLDKLLEYNNGIVKKNSFWRMFYFSATTITTIGYGDIVPLSDGLRIIIAIEAILGIIFIGLFINAFGDLLRKK